jgi:hypothetical protein
MIARFVRSSVFVVGDVGIDGVDGVANVILRAPGREKPNDRSICNRRSSLSAMLALTAVTALPMSAILIRSWPDRR